MKTIQDLIRSRMNSTEEEDTPDKNAEFKTQLANSMDEHGARYVYDIEHNLLFHRTAHDVIQITVFTSSQINLASDTPSS